MHYADNSMPGVQFQHVEVEVDELLGGKVVS